MRGIIFRMQTAIAILKKIWRVVRWPILVAVVGYVGLVVYFMTQIPKMDAAAIEKINTAKLTMKDVDGSNLPPQPDPKLVDATVEGVDANKNGIRDDVELAIFKKYPNDIKVRGAALQYALAIQHYLVDIVASDSFQAAAQQQERASSCLSEIIGADKSQDQYSQTQLVKESVRKLVVNTDSRIQVANKNTKLIRSYASLPAPYCDVE